MSQGGGRIRTHVPPRGPGSGPPRCWSYARGGSCRDGRVGPRIPDDQPGDLGPGRSGLAAPAGHVQPRVRVGRRRPKLLRRVAHALAAHGPLHRLRKGPGRPGSPLPASPGHRLPGGPDLLLGRPNHGPHARPLRRRRRGRPPSGRKLPNSRRRTGRQLLLRLPGPGPPASPTDPTLRPGVSLRARLRQARKHPPRDGRRGSPGRPPPVRHPHRAPPVRSGGRARRRDPRRGRPGGPGERRGLDPSRGRAGRGRASRGRGDRARRGVPQRRTPSPPRPSWPPPSWT